MMFDIYVQGKSCGTESKIDRSRLTEFSFERTRNDKQE
jgi:hypothetical protein